MSEQINKPEQPFAPLVRALQEGEAQRLSQCIEQIDNRLVNCRKSLEEYRRLRVALRVINSQLSRLGAEPLSLADDMAIIAGGNAVVKMKLRQRLIKSSRSARLPATYAPNPPRAFPKVPICTKTRSPSPYLFTTPAPVPPKMPVACLDFLTTGVLFSDSAELLTQSDSQAISFGSSVHESSSVSLLTLTQVFKSLMYIKAGAFPLFSHCSIRFPQNGLNRRNMD